MSSDNSMGKFLAISNCGLHRNSFQPSALSQYGPQGHSKLTSSRDVFAMNLKLSKKHFDIIIIIISLGFN
jgi:hypothetical protein